MTLEGSRKSYISEVVRSLSKQRGTDQHSREQDGVLTELLHKTLKQTERRFTVYNTKFQKSPNSAQNIQKFCGIVSRMEKHINSSFNDSGILNCEIQTSAPHIHREVLRNCYKLLVDDLDLSSTSLVDDLQSDIMSASDIASIKGKGHQKRQNEEFFTYIIGRLTLQEFHNILLPAISKNHSHVADALISELDRLEKDYEDTICIACKSRQYVQVKRLATPLLMQKSISLSLFSDLNGPGLPNSVKWTELRRATSDEDIIKAMKAKYPDFFHDFMLQETASLECSCVPSSLQADASLPDACLSFEAMSRSASSESSQLADFNEQDFDGECIDAIAFQMDDVEESYRMTANPRGICLIINIINFKIKDTTITNHGSIHDTEKLTAVFTKLQFSVTTLVDVSASQMEEKLKEIGGQDHSKYDAFACVIMAPGFQNFVIGNDGMRISFVELLNPFLTSKCPSLAGKPKLFFCQSSRGSRFMEGLKHSTETDPAAHTPDGADFLISYSTVEGYASFRDKTKGSIYIDALAHILDRHADTQDILTCMQMTNRTVGMQTLGRNFKQMPSPIFTLTKKVHLTADPLWPYTDTTVSKSNTSLEELHSQATK